MISTISVIIVIIILFYINSVFGKHASKCVGRNGTFMYTSLIYFLLMLAYMCWNINECYEHVNIMNTQLLVIFAVIALTTFIINLLFLHHL